MTAPSFAIETKGLTKHYSQIVDLGSGWNFFDTPVAVLLLLSYAIAGHALAVLIARWCGA